MNFTSCETLRSTKRFPPIIIYLKENAEKVQDCDKLVGLEELRPIVAAGCSESKTRTASINEVRNIEAPRQRD